MMTETGIRRTDDGRAFCEACGNDLCAEGSVMFTKHLDAKTFFENRYTCLKCGAEVSQRHERSKDDKIYWG